MSVRPSFDFVVGINDAIPADPRFVLDHDTFETLWEEPIPLLMDGDFPEQLAKPAWYLDYEKNVIYPDRIFFNGNPATGLTEKLPVVGLVIDEAPEDMSRALFGVFPGFFKKYDGYLVIKPEPEPTKWAAIQMKNREGADLFETAVKEGRFYDTWTLWYTDWYWRRAIHVMHHMGWTGVTREMLKMMVVYYWC